MQPVIPMLFPTMTPDSTMTRYAQIVALGMLAVMVLGAVAVMVVVYSFDTNAALPSPVVFILGSGFSYALHALGSTQGATQTQSAAQQAVNLVSPPGLSQGRGGPGGAGGQGGAGGIGGLPDGSSGASGVNGVNDPAGGPHA